MGIQNSVASDHYSKPIGYTTTEQVIKPFKMTTSSIAGNQSISKSSVSSKARESRDDLLSNDPVTLMTLLRKIGNAYVQQIQVFDKQAAIEQYKKLPEKQYRTGWVLTQVG